MSFHTISLPENCCMRLLTKNDSLKPQFHPVNDLSDLAVIEMVDGAMLAYSFAPTSKSKLTNRTEAQDTICSLKDGKAPCLRFFPCLFPHL